MSACKLKTPISYYGGKQNLVSKILPLLPEHNLYCEPFVGGGAIFWSKQPSEVEVINDVNKELINFYEVVQNDFVDLEKKIRITLHSRTLHRDAKAMYEHPHLFSKLDRAWAVWVLSSQSFSAMLDGTWGYDIKRGTTSRKIANKRQSFTEEHAIRMQNVQIECTDAIRIIRSRDTKDSLFYCDPPYYNSDCGHYDGYTIEDYERLLDLLSRIEGKFILSSYPSPILKSYAKTHGWHQIEIHQTVSVANKSQSRKSKIEVLTSNFAIDLNNGKT